MPAYTWKRHTQYTVQIHTFGIKHMIWYLNLANLAFKQTYFLIFFIFFKIEMMCTLFLNQF